MGCQQKLPTSSGTHMREWPAEGFMANSSLRPSNCGQEWDKAAYGLPFFSFGDRLCNEDINCPEEEWLPVDCSSIHCRDLENNGQHHEESPVLHQHLSQTNPKSTLAKHLSVILLLLQQTVQQPVKDEILQRRWRWVGHTRCKSASHDKPSSAIHKAEGSEAGQETAGTMTWMQMWRGLAVRKIQLQNHVRK